MATGVQTGTTFTLLDQILMGGGTGGPCTHTHTQDEGLYVIKGKCTFNAGGHHGMIAGDGAFIHIPSLTEHSFVVDDDQTQILNFYLPAGFEQLLIGISHPADSMTMPPPGLSLPPPHLVEKLAADYGQVGITGMPFKDKPSPEKMVTRPLEGATEFPYVTTAPHVPRYWYEGALWSVLADSKQTAGRYSMIEKLLSQSYRERPHVQKDMDEVFYILEGSAKMLVGDKVETAEKGDLVFIPRGTVHGLRVISETVKLLNLHTPSGIEKILPLFGDTAKDHTLPPHDFQSRSINERHLLDISKGLGITFPAVDDPLK